MHALYQDIKKQWKSHNLLCIVRMVKLGHSEHPCGYVVIPHEYINLVTTGIEHDMIDAYGGITFQGPMSLEANATPQYVVGFDMMHAFDVAFDDAGHSICIRTIEDGVRETEKLAQRIRNYIDCHTD